MPDEAPSGDKALYVFIEMVALVCLFECGDSYREHAWLGGTVWAVVGLFLFLLGIKWPRIKSKIPTAPLRRIEHASNDYRYRYGVGVLMIGLAGFYAVNSLHSLRNDLDIYAMPRNITQLQASQLHRLLSESHPGAMVDVIVNPGDEEAREYAAQIVNTLNGAGEWDSTFMTVDPWQPDPRNLVEKDGVYIANLRMMSGLEIQECHPPASYDPKHPPAAFLLAQAMAKAQIEVNGSGSSSLCKKYAVSIIVAHRPRKIGLQEPALARIGRWLQKVAYGQ